MRENPLSSNVFAGKRYGVPPFGTMAHSYVRAHESEADAFRAFAGMYPGTTLLVDTYDTIEGVRRAIEVSRNENDGIRFGAVRLDSGDLAALAREARRLLDEAGLMDVRIFASSGLDEYEIAKLVDAGAPIDGFGVGTKLVVSADATNLDMAYKLVEYAGELRTKLSSRKEVYPGRKQGWRTKKDGVFTGDVIGRADEAFAEEPLLRAVMRAGERTEAGRVTLEAARNYARVQIESLPPEIRAIPRAKSAYPVVTGAALQELCRRALERFENRRVSTGA